MISLKVKTGKHGIVHCHGILSICSWLQDSRYFFSFQQEQPYGPKLQCTKQLRMDVLCLTDCQMQCPSSLVQGKDLDGEEFEVGRTNQKWTFLLCIQSLSSGIFGSTKDIQEKARRSFSCLNKLSGDQQENTANHISTRRKKGAVMDESCMNCLEKQTTNLSLH